MKEALGTPARSQGSHNTSRHCVPGEEVLPRQKLVYQLTVTTCLLLSSRSSIKCTVTCSDMLLSLEKEVSSGEKWDFSHNIP
ncbi:hypothetical protein E2C01_058968 [Portunus trituberculatus]|uniref:Uncharacterized protein n=1 Tax=Portunus trituberculatus TaxID=210409 RepID=A0A5B7H4L1_PORTR|nr:hypothetical protein [Portunus trituberculatus]